MMDWQVEFHLLYIMKKHHANNIPRVTNHVRELARALVLIFKHRFSIRCNAHHGDGHSSEPIPFQLAELVC
jgi:hypothetical protein